MFFSSSIASCWAELLGARLGVSTCFNLRPSVSFAFCSAALEVKPNPTGNCRSYFSFSGNSSEALAGWWNSWHVCKCWNNPERNTLPFLERARWSGFCRNLCASQIETGTSSRITSRTNFTNFRLEEKKMANKWQPDGIDMAKIWVIWEPKGPTRIAWHCLAAVSSRGDKRLEKKRRRQCF